MTVQVSFSGDYRSLVTPETSQKINAISEAMNARTSAGAEFLGWKNWPSEIDSQLVERIQKTAEKIQQQADVLVVIGIGGSYLGAKAVLEALRQPFQVTEKVEIIFAGHLVSGAYLKNLLTYLDTKEVAVNVISKSGKTTEPAIAFRFIQDYMEKRYGQEAAERIYVTTDAEKGALLDVAKEKDYARFVVPDDIGGRYSVLTSVGLLPIAAAGHSIDHLLAGAKRAEGELATVDLEENPAIQYALVRDHLYSTGYPVEISAIFEERLKFVQEWWKQLVGESEGKQGKGIFPASVQYSTDLHSLGQYVQDGKRMLFETFLKVASVEDDITMQLAENDSDELNYLAGKTLHTVNDAVQQATAEAHLSGGVPLVTLEIPDLSEDTIGYLLYFYMISCAYSAYLLEINPFDQPGVEEYKVNMFRLLNKPGF
ncbi:glucose-6-phosphate isomerase [Chryseomicrobium sp. FSL W7-1435]|uniref:glucose-6-phosphate isomerase n=1 Tax=Chryseomicrobium sp. FSL W7-1435 TaxID=2921704 RepID=UPI00315B3A92